MVNEKLEAARRGWEGGSDVYSTLLRPDTLEKGKNAMNSEELVAQTAVLLLAGQDTTANSVTFGLRELAKDPEFQEKLRMEIHSYVEGSKSGIAYDNLPLLNAFIKRLLSGPN
ncbi:cytochrome P450 [Mycena vulgaris]|nr:cytochrome P450 [Mycena vulgaris]